LAAGVGAAQAAVPFDGERLQYAFALLRTAVLPSAQTSIEGGERRLGVWLGRLGAQAVDFSDRREGFRNLNTREEAAALERYWREGRGRL